MRCASGNEFAFLTEKMDANDYQDDELIKELYAPDSALPAKIIYLLNSLNPCIELRQ